jgi:hypothetical protein
MTDDFRSTERESDATIVSAAMRLAQQISKALGAGRGRRSSDDLERAAILREVFEYAAGGGGAPKDDTGDARE